MNFHQNLPAGGFEFEAKTKELEGFQKSGNAKCWKAVFNPPPPPTVRFY